MARQTIGEFLQTLRRANGYTQQEVADRLGISNRTLSAWETDRAYPDILTLPELADLYGVTADEILRGERNAKQERESPAELSPKQERIALNRKLGENIPGNYWLFALYCAGCIVSFLSIFDFLFAITLILAAAGIICILLSIILRISFYLKAKLYADEDETEEQKRYLYRLQEMNRKTVFAQTVVTAGVAAFMWMTAVVASDYAKMIFVIFFAIVFTLLFVAGAAITIAANSRIVRRFGREEQIAQLKKNEKRMTICFASTLLAVFAFVTTGLVLCWNLFPAFEVRVFGSYQDVVSYLSTLEVTEEDVFLLRDCEIEPGSYLLDFSPFINGEAGDEDVYLGCGFYGRERRYPERVELFTFDRNGDFFFHDYADAVYDEKGNIVAFNARDSALQTTDLIRDGLLGKYRDGYEIRTVDDVTQFGVRYRYDFGDIGEIVLLVGLSLPELIGISVYFAGRKKIVVYP